MASHGESSVSPNTESERATVGGGCFWCVEAVYQRIDGVTSVKSGYAGGATINPTYEQVCSGTTGHAEVVQIEFDPSIVTYAQILDRFFVSHDPTTLNRQGADTGTQYRSVIFYENDRQKQIAEQRRIVAAQHYRDPIVTEISPLSEFYAAERYHQNYFNDNPRSGYCVMVIRPKLKALGFEV
jgi:peptide-methionine (S)-S-oxide reductase